MYKEKFRTKKTRGTVSRRRRIYVPNTHYVFTIESDIIPLELNAQSQRLDGEKKSLSNKLYGTFEVRLSNRFRWENLNSTWSHVIPIHFALPQNLIRIIWFESFDFVFKIFALTYAQAIFSLLCAHSPSLSLHECLCVSQTNCRCGCGCGSFYSTHSIAFQIEYFDRACSHSWRLAFLKVLLNLHLCLHRNHN